MSHLAGALGIDSPNSGSDHFFTPLDKFRVWHAEDRFTLDPCGHNRSPVTCFLRDEAHGFVCVLPVDGLKYLWVGHSVFCNPPYSIIEPWIEKAFQMMCDRACPVIRFLLPAMKTEQPWWQTYVEPYRDHRKHDLPFVLETEFLAKRVAHGTPENPLALGMTGGTFPSVTLRYSRR